MPVSNTTRNRAHDLRAFGPWWTFLGGPLFNQPAKVILDAVRATAKTGTNPAQHYKTLQGRPPAVVLDWGTSAARFEVRHRGVLDVFELSVRNGARRPLRSSRIVQEVVRLKDKLRP